MSVDKATQDRWDEEDNPFGIDTSIFMPERETKGGFIVDRQPMKLYTAGPMTWVPHFNYPAFDALAMMLRAKGFKVISPAEMDSPEVRAAAMASETGNPADLPPDETWGDMLARDVKLIADEADGVVLMPGWIDSQGARLEAFIARHVSKPVFYYVGGQPKYDALHSAICSCTDLWPLEGTWGTDLIELDDAELDHVLTAADTLTLMKMEQDAVVADMKASQSDSSTISWEAPNAGADTINFILGDEWIAPMEAMKEAEPSILEPLMEKDTNPKDDIGSTKLPMHLWPETASVMGALGLLDGALKYGRSNWRAAGIRYSIYIDAARRHLAAAFEGEDVDPDSGLPHEAHALACLAIIIDAKAAGTLTDDRQFNGSGWRKFITDATDHVEELKTKHSDHNPKHYTIEDRP